MADSSGSVAPITWRAAVTASWPSSTIATSGPPVMKSTSSPKNGLLGVLGVVLLGELAAGRHVLERDDSQALALEAGDHLAGESAGEGVGLYQDQSPVHGFLSGRVGSSRPRTAGCVSGLAAVARGLARPAWPWGAALALGRWWWGSLAGR